LSRFIFFCDSGPFETLFIVKLCNDTAQIEGDLLELARSAPQSREGKQAASDLLGRYQQRVYVWCLKYVRQHEQALDLAQEVLISAYRNLPSFKGQSRFSSWLFVIARNRCLSEVRRPRLLLDDDRQPDDLYSAGPTPAQVFEEKRDEESLLELIRTTLTSEEQEVIWLRCFECLPVDTITRMLGIQQSSGARGLLQSARRKLRRAASDTVSVTEGGPS
jgi:RNA polymerase sigma-70 factor, ECF subfamily